MRDTRQEIVERGGDVVAVGTGQFWYAKSLIDEYELPYLVLLDEDGEAAEAAAVRTARLRELVGPRVAVGASRAFAAGHRQHKTGKRPTQLGATFVVGPGSTLRYAHLDGNVTDHAPMDEVMAALV